MRRGVGKRCFGFLSEDGDYAHCSRQEFAGNIKQNERSQTYPHVLSGECNCGERHGRQARSGMNDEVKKRKLVQKYRYRDRSGRVLFEVLRYRPKAFRQRRPIGDGRWAWDLDGVKKPPYRLPELLAADPKRSVYIVEGEKDADALANRGFVATTNPGGAGKWRDKYSEFLVGRKVVILPDNDEAGHAHAERVARSLSTVAKRIKIVNLPDLPPQGDVSDWLASGGTPKTLKALVSEAPRYIPAEGTQSDLPFHTAAEMSRARHQPVKWVVRGIVAAGSITDVLGKVKFAGKTTFLTEMSSAVVRGSTFLGFDTSRSPVVYLSEQPWTSFQEALKRANLQERSDFIFLLWPEVMKEDWEKVADAAIKECLQHKARLLVVDTIAPFAGLAGATENDSGHALGAMKPLQAATSAGIGVVIVQHERKGGGELVESGRGSTAFAGAVDNLLCISRPRGKSKPTFRELRAESRFDETPSSLLIELTDHGYVSHGEVRPIADEEARASILEALPVSEKTAMTLPALMKACEISRTTAQKAITALLTEKLVERVGGGKRGSPYRFLAPKISTTEQD